MSSTVRYRAAEEMYRSLPLWNNVPERDRRDLYEDLLVSPKSSKRANFCQKKTEKLKAMRKRLIFRISLFRDVP